MNSIKNSLNSVNQKVSRLLMEGQIGEDGQGDNQRVIEGT